MGKVIGCIMLYIVSVQSGPVAAGFALLFAKFFSDWSQPTVWGTCTDLGGRCSATVFSIINTSGTIGGIVMPLVFGYVLDLYTTKLAVAGVTTSQTEWGPLFLLLAAARVGSLGAVPPGGNFYAVFPHNLLVSLFAPVFVFVVLALTLGVRRFWRAVAPPQEEPVAPGALPEAAGNALTLKFLDGGHGEGCHNEDDRWTHARRRAHHLTFYGFLLCFASTSVATLYHYAFGWVAPYDLPSIPKLLGAVGGVLLLLGTAQLLRLRLARHPAQGDAAQKPMDLGFIVLLLLTSVTGLGLWFARGLPGQTVWLAVHLGVVMALFVTLPFGKFAHGVFRCAALLKYQIERRQPDRLRLKAD